MFYPPRKIKTSDGLLDGTIFWNLCLIPIFSGLGKSTELIHFMLYAYSVFCPFECHLYSVILSSYPEVWAFELDRLVFNLGFKSLVVSGCRPPSFLESISLYRDTCFTRLFLRIKGDNETEHLSTSPEMEECSNRSCCSCYVCL